MYTNSCNSVSLFHVPFLFAASPLSANSSCVSMLLHVSKLTLVVRHSGTMKSKEFLLSQTLPSCSNHPSSPEQPKARKSRQISRLINWHPAPYFSYLVSFPLLSSCCAWQQSLMGALILPSLYQRKKKLPFLISKCSIFENLWIPLLLYSHYLFTDTYTLHFITPHPPLCWICALILYPLLSHHTSPLYSIWFLIRF